MPTVPRLNGPQVQQAAMPNARFEANAGAGAFGDLGTKQLTTAAVDTVGVVDKVYREEKAKADDTVVKKAYADMLKASNTLRWDPDSGAFGKKGKDAFGVPDEYGKRFDDSAAEIEKGLSNDDQKRMFNEMRQKMRVDFDADLQKHVFMEKGKYELEVTDNAIKAEQDNAILNYHDPEKVAQSLELQKSLLVDHAQKNGKSAEWLQQQTALITGKTHEGIINRMIQNGNDMEAKNYFEAHKDEMSGSDIGQMEKVVHAASTKAEAVRITDELMAKYSNMGDALKDPRVKKLEDEDLRLALEDRIQNQYGVKERARAMKAENLLRNATDIVEKSGDYTKVPPQIVAQLDMGQRRTLQAYAKAVSEGDQIATDWSRYYELKTMASSPELANKFAQTNLLTERMRLGNTEFKELMNLQTSMRNKDGKSDDELKGIRTRTQIINDALAAADIDPTPKQGTKDAERVNQLRRRMDEIDQAYFTQNKKRMSNEELAQQVDKQLTKVITDKGWLYDTKKYSFETEKGEAVGVAVKNIPRPERLKIEQALRSNNKPVTDDNITQLFMKSQGIKDLFRGN